MKELSIKTGAASLRFWGKIKGTQADYYVAEAVLAGGEAEGGQEEAETQEPGEPRGVGVNQFAYFVANSPLAEWVALPDLKPRHINNARRIKQMLTGNLNSKIYTNPFFFETEKFYLRAQIARISLSTTLCPKGLFRTVEESVRDIEDNTPEEGEIVKPTTD